MIVVHNADGAARRCRGDKDSVNDDKATKDDAATMKRLTKSASTTIDNRRSAMAQSSREVERCTHWTKKELNRIADAAKIYGELDLRESKWELIEKAVVAAAGLVVSMRRSGVNSIEWKYNAADDEITIGEFDDCVDRLFDECVCAEITENHKPADHKARKLWARAFQFCAEVDGLL